MAICEKCKKYQKEIQGCLYMDADCVNGSEFEPLTNYDRLIDMNVDEMAEFLMEWFMRCMMGKAPLNVKEWLESVVDD